MRFAANNAEALEQVSSKESCDFCLSNWQKIEDDWNEAWNIKDKLISVLRISVTLNASVPPLIRETHRATCSTI